MALTRIKSDVEHRHLGYVRLWIEDLKKIVALIREAAPGDIKIVVDDKYTTNDVEDLSGYEEVRMKSIVVTAPRIALLLGPQVATLNMEDPGSLMLGIATQIERIAKQRRRRFAGILPAIATTVMIGLPASGLDRSSGGAILVARTKGDAPPWLERNRDALIINVAVSLVVGVLAFFAGKYWG